MKQWGEMTYLFYRVAIAFSAAGLALTAIGEPMALKASKDMFARSNERNRNSGGSRQLLVSQVPYVRSLIGFDLSDVTNRIVTASFRFQQQNTVPEACDLTVAKMVQTTNNSIWEEGAGALGVKGQIAQEGEATYGSSAFPDVPWERESGDTLPDLGDDHLWETPFATLENIEWKKDAWVEIKITDVQLLEKIRKSENPILTIGLWGTSGNGLYVIKSKESGTSPELVLVLDEKNGGEQ